jgi:hypothetical protein
MVAGLGVSATYPSFVPTPPSHRRCVHDYRVSRVRHISLTIAASVTWASWGYGSPSPLARVPTKLDLMPAMQGYPHSFGWVRTHLPYQVRQASLALRHGLAPRPMGFMSVSFVMCRYAVTTGIRPVCGQEDCELRSYAVPRAGSLAAERTQLSGAVHRVRLQSTRGSLPPPLLQNRA